LNPQPTTYRERYLDPNFDSFNANYVNLYNEYSVGNTQPAPLRNAIYRDGNTGTPLHVLVHIRVANAPADDPGLIVAYHRLTRHDPRFGQIPTPFDSLGLGFFGDIIDGQAPMTVHIPDALYAQLPQVQVPSAGLLTQAIADDPQAELFGPYAAGDPDVAAVTTRQLVIVPNQYAAPFLTTGLKPKAAYLALSGLITRDNQDVACGPLLDWLRTTLTRRAGAAGPNPATCNVPLVPPPFVNPQDQQAFATYRLNVLHSDFPHLRPGLHHNSAVLIAQGITALTSEQRLTREEAQQHRSDRDAPKTAHDYFGVLLDRLMRWCQVANERHLPPIYETIANTKKGRVRLVLQTALEDALTALNYVDDFPVSTTLATKIVELKWHSNLRDDFTVGLNVFSLGSLEEEAMETQRRFNHHADAISGGDAAPSLMDMATIQDSKLDVCIPRTFAQLRYLVERSQALWQVLLGSEHPVTQQHQLYRRLLITHEKRLENVVPRDPAMRYIVPALLARVIQLDVNAWIHAQVQSASPVPFRSLTDVFGEIERQRPWEPHFPPSYLLSEVPSTHGISTVVPPPAYPTAITQHGSHITAPTDASTLSRSVGTGGNSTVGSAPSKATGSAMLRNLLYQQDIFGKFKALGIKARPLKDSLKARQIEPPLNARNTRMCITYHVHGICNERCKLAADHYHHTSAEDEALRTWCESHYKIE
jgi:hypothetical protein